MKFLYDISLKKNKIFQVVLIFSGLVVFYAVTFSGQMISGDNQTQFDQTMQILERGQIGFDKPLNNATFTMSTRYRLGQKNLYYQMYGVGHSFLTLPVTAIVYFLSPSSYPHLNGLIYKAWSANAVIFSAITVTCYWIIIRTMLSPVMAVILTVSLAIASPFWMFSDQCWNNLSKTMCLTIAIVCFVLSVNEKNIYFKYWIFIGIFVGFAFIIRPFGVTVVPAFLYLVFYYQNLKSNQFFSKAAFNFVIPVGICALLVIAFNLYRFGSPFDFGQPPGNTEFTTSWYEGIKGNLFAPSKSLLYFSPVTILVIPAFLILLIFRLSWLSGFSILFFAPYIIMMPKFHGWHGGPSDLFQRYWFPVLPVAYLVIAGAWSCIQSKICKNMILYLIILLSVIGIHHNFFSATTNGRESYSFANNNGKIIKNNPDFELINMRSDVSDLILGRTLIADAQRTLLKTNPKTFAILPSVSNPYIRVIVGGIFLSLCVFFSILLEKNNKRLRESERFEL